ncbi:hypothetical protein FF1_038182 [Malus domestica]
MIRDFPEAPRVINTAQGRRRHAGVSRARGTSSQREGGNNNGEEDGSETVNRGSVGHIGVVNTLITQVSSRETANPTIGATNMVTDHAHGSMEWMNGHNTIGLPIISMGVMEEGGQSGRALGTRRVNMRRRQVEAEAKMRVKGVESNSQYPTGMVDHGSQYGQIE